MSMKWRNVAKKGKERGERLRAEFELPFRYNARQFYENNQELKQAIDQIKNGYYSPENPDLFQDIVNSLIGDNGDQ